MRRNIWLSLFIGLIILLFSIKKLKDYPVPQLKRKPKVRTAFRKEALGRIAIIIDDIGFNNKKEIKEIIGLKYPITLSILPFQPFSLKVAKMAHAANKEIILHLPMEPYNYPRENPGNGMLTTYMDEVELINQLKKNLDAIPYIIGVNNHMGSKFTEDYERMRIVMGVLKRRGLFFVDSLTSHKSVGYKVALEVGVYAEKRDIFLDNKRDIEYIRKELKRLKIISLKKGKAIGIGHPYPNTVRALKEMLPRFKKDGIKIVKLSSLVKDRN